MYRLTRPGGFVLINVAAMEILRGDHSVLSHEVRRYSRDRLRRLVTGAGFEIVRLTHTNQTLFLPMLAVRAVHRWRGLAAEADAQQEIAVPPAPINAVPERPALRREPLGAAVRRPVGSSLLCLAKKPCLLRSSGCRTTSTPAGAGSWKPRARKRSAEDVVRNSQAASRRSHLEHLKPETPPIGAPAALFGRHEDLVRLDRDRAVVAGDELGGDANLQIEPRGQRLRRQLAAAR